MNEPPSAPYESGRVATSVIMADVNKDGLLDVVIAGGSGISVLLGQESF